MRLYLKSLILKGAKFIVVTSEKKNLFTRFCTSVYGKVILKGAFFFLITPKI